MLNNNKVVNYWSDEAHKSKVLGKAVSNIASVTNLTENFDFNKIKDRLEKEEIVKKVEVLEDKIIVLGEYEGVKGEVKLVINKNDKLIKSEILSAAKLQGPNTGVKNTILQNSIKKPHALVSIMEFDLKNPLVSYYMQMMILAKAHDYEFILDMSAKRIFPKEYENYLNKVSKTTLITNVFTSILSTDGWVITTGLTRFHLKELEINHVTNHSLILGLFKTINVNRILKGEILSDVLFDFGGGKYFTILSIDDAIDNLSSSYLDKNRYLANHGSNKNRQIIVPIKNPNIDFSNISASIDLKEFETAGINYESFDFLIARVKAARETFDYLFDFFQEKNNFVFRVEYELEYGEQREYIYAVISGIKGGMLEGELIRDSINNPSLKKESHVSIAIEKITDWEIRIEGNFIVNYSNAYLLKVLKEYFIEQ